MSVAETIKASEQKMQKTIAAFITDLGKIRTGRAHVGLLDHIHVDYYGNPTPINQVGNVTLVDGRTIGVQVWEKNMLSAVEKAIRDADLGLNPNTNGDMVRVPMPPLTEERRKELVKVVKSEGETAKVSIRNARRDGNEQLKKQVKDKVISEDDERRGQDDIQKQTDKAVVEIDRLIAEKEKEIMTV